MNPIDIVLLICFIPAIIQGFRKGLISQVFSFLALILGTYIAYSFSNIFIDYLKEYITANHIILYVIAFALIFIAVGIVLSIIAKLLESIISIIMLGWLNRLLGIIFAVLKMALILGILIILFNTLSLEYKIVDEAILAKSELYVFLKDTSYLVFPYFKKLLQ